MSERRKRWGAGTAALVLSSTMAVSAQALTSSTAFSAPTVSGDDTPEAVIVVLKDQLAGTPADTRHTAPRKAIREPEALQSTRTAFDGPEVPSAQELAPGKGVTVAFIADGLDPNLTDFTRADGSKVIVDYQDFSGEGPNSPANGAEA